MSDNAPTPELVALLPCICGAVVDADECPYPTGRLSDPGPGRAVFQVVCTNPECGWQAIGFGADGARKAWNTRAATVPQGVVESEDFAHGYVKGYRAGLGAASAECRRIGTALDGGGNSYVRYEDAIKCSVSVAGLHAPRPDATPHSTEDCYQHFLSYSGLSDSPVYRYTYFHGADVGLDRPQELIDSAHDVPGLVGGVRVLDRGFTFSKGVNVPTVLVGFAPEDWDSRDAYADAIDAAMTPQQGG